MALVSSLFTAITGMRNHQTMLDVIANNVANVNTVGFKAGRVQFRDLLSQTISGASGSDSINNRGGTNPVQFGTGVAVASIDTSFRQGTLQATGNATDMAINGDGFYIVETGNTQIYTRAGSFRFDSLGRLVDPSGGLIQGWSASVDPNDMLGRLRVDSSNPANIGNITINAGQTIRAMETRNVELVGNLDAGATAANLTNSAGVAGTTNITVQDNAGVPGVYNYTVGTHEITYSVYDSLGNAHQLTTTLMNLSGTQIPGADPGMVYQNNTWSWTVDTDPSDTSVHLALDNTTYLDPTDPTGNTTIRASSSGLVNFTTTGALNWVAYGDRNAEHFGTNPAGTAANDPNVPGGNALPALPGTWAAIADADTLDGSIIGFEGATVTNSTFAGAAETNVAPFTPVNPAFDQEAAFALMKLPIVLVYQNVPVGSPTPPTGTTAGTLVQSLDALGAVQTGIQLPDGVTAENWYVQSFNIDWGSVSTITQADFDRAANLTGVAGDDAANDGALAADEADGHDFVWDPYVVSQNDGLRDGLTQDTTGEFRDVAGVSTYIPRFTAIMRAQDGYAQGILQGISVSADGKVIGAFTNGVSQELAQVAIATFENPAGLAKVGETHFTTTANSGNAIVGTALTGGRGSIIGGVVEQSNVDLSQELTDMIVAQRGFEVNARLITTSDRILDTLVNLGR